MQLWLVEQSRRMANNATKAITNDTGNDEAGLGFIPTDNARQLALALSEGTPETVESDKLTNEIPAPLKHLLQTMQLPEAFCDWAALMLLPELDRRWGTLLAWLNDDAAKRYLTAGIAQRLAGEPDFALPKLLSAQSPLRQMGLIEETGQFAPLPDQPLRFVPSIALWLLHGNRHPEIDPILAGAVRQLPNAPTNVFGVEADAFSDTNTCQVVGSPGSGRAIVSQALQGKSLVLDANRMGQNPKALLRSAVRDATLRESALIIMDADSLPLAEISQLPMNKARLFVTTQTRLDLEWPVLSLPALNSVRARDLWRYGLGDDALADRIAHQFRLPAQDILQVAQNHHGTDQATISRACMQRSSTVLDRYAAQLELRHSWDDLILPQKQLRLLHSIVERATHARQVYEQWGFGEKLAPERGLTALFAGPSGAGKTLSARIVANELNLPLYRVDLSATVSKYIGETEKQLEQIFSAAEAGNACLFFDECDALFSKRSEVSDAHDRYANLETSYLLQRLESHRGIVFMASNYPQNIDEAFTRRIDLTVDYAMPDATLRQALWTRLIPDAAEAEIDTDTLGAQFELSGGSIRNCLLSAAFLAASEGVGIETRHCLMAIAQEYEKTGRPLTRAEFGEAFVLLRPRMGG